MTPTQWLHAVAADDRLRPLQKLIAALIARQMDERGRATISISDLASACGCTERDAKTQLHWLAAYGWLLAERDGAVMKVGAMTSLSAASLL
jgi:hypothetical protein